MLILWSPDLQFKADPERQIFEKSEIYWEVVDQEIFFHIFVVMFEVMFEPRLRLWRLHLVNRAGAIYLIDLNNPSVYSLKGNNVVYSQH